MREVKKLPSIADVIENTKITSISRDMLVIFNYISNIQRVLIVHMIIYNHIAPNNGNTMIIYNMIYGAFINICIGDCVYADYF